MSPSSESFVDTTFGRKGLGAWIAPFGLVAIIYQLVALLYAAFNLDKGGGGSYGGPVLLLGVLIFLGLLLFTATLFFVQGVRTVQRIEIDKETLTCKVRFFYGREVEFDLRDIVSVSPYRLGRLLRNFLTPLGRGGHNYKVQLSNGRSFFVSAAVPGIDRFIGRIGASVRRCTEQGCS